MHVSTKLKLCGVSWDINFYCKGNSCLHHLGVQIKILLLSYVFISSAQYFIAAVAKNLSPSMKALEKYFSRLQWFKTKNSYWIFELLFPWYCSCIAKDPLAPEFVLFCLQKSRLSSTGLFHFRRLHERQLIIRNQWKHADMLLRWMQSDKILSGLFTLTFRRLMSAIVDVQHR